METALKIAQLFGLIAELVKVVEAAIPEQGKGKEKLQAVVSLLEITGQVGKDLLPKVVDIVGIVVALYNATGIFRK